MSALPLEGLRILDLSRLLPGPYATMLLADFGAEVIKVEDTAGGDGFRARFPQKNGLSYLHLILNRNKKSLSVNLKHPAGRDLFHRLAAQSHIVLEQFRPGVVDRLGIDYKTVSARSPRIVYCSLSGFGQEGPLRDVVAHNPNYMSLAGALGLVGVEGGPPVIGGVQVTDLVAGLFAALSMLIAVRAAERTGEGRYVDLALLDATVSLLVSPAAYYFGNQVAPQRGQDLIGGFYPCVRVYETSDGGHMTIAAAEAHFWQNLCRYFGREDFIPCQFDQGAKRLEMIAFFEDAFHQRTRDEWWELLRDRQVCIGPVLGVDEALASPQVLQREMVVECTHPIAGPIRTLGNPMKLSNARPLVAGPAPLLGEHSAELARAAGLDEASVSTLLEQGVLRTAGERKG